MNTYYCINVAACDSRLESERVAGTLFGEFGDNEIPDKDDFIGVTELFDIGLPVNSITSWGELNLVTRPPDLSVLSNRNSNGREYWFLKAP